MNVPKNKIIRLSVTENAASDDFQLAGNDAYTMALKAGYDEAAAEEIGTAAETAHGILREDPAEFRRIWGKG